MTGKWQQVTSLKKREWIYLILIGIIGGSLPFYLFFTGLSQVPAINAAIIQKTLVFWVILLAIPFLKEKLSVLQILAIVMLFGSNLVIGGFQHFQFSRGELYILLATVLWAVETILAKKILSSVHPDIVVAARMGFGAVILTVAAAFIAPAGLSKVLSLTSTQYMWLSVSIVLLSGYVMSWYRALKYSSAITVTAILVSSTIITNILSSVFITHVWSWNLHFQNSLLIIGMVLFYFGSKRKTYEKAVAMKD